MPEIDDIDEQINALAAREVAATLSPEDQVRADKLAELADRKAALAVAEKRKRTLVMASREAAARKAAGGRYLVKGVDLGDLLPEADPPSLPGAGVLIVRSPPTEPIDVLAVFTREHEANEKPLPDLMVDLVLASVVDPPTDGAEGMRLRGFFESSIGKGSAISVGNEVTRLGGMRARQAKRGRGQA